MYVQYISQYNVVKQTHYYVVISNERLLAVNAHLSLQVGGSAGPQAWYTLSAGHSTAGELPNNKYINLLWTNCTNYSQSLNSVSLDTIQNYIGFIQFTSHAFCFLCYYKTGIIEVQRMACCLTTQISVVPPVYADAKLRASCCIGLKTGADHSWVAHMTTVKLAASEVIFRGEVGMTLFEQTGEKSEQDLFKYVKILFWCQHGANYEHAK